MAASELRLMRSIICLALAMIVAWPRVTPAQSLLQNITFLTEEMQLNSQLIRASLAMRAAEGQLTVTNRYFEHEASLSPLNGTQEIIDSIERGIAAVGNGDSAEASEIFDPLIEGFEQAVSAEEHKVYVSRSSVEGMYYVLTAAAQDVHAQAIQSYGSDLYYWRSLSAVQAGDRDGAKRFLARAIELSPANGWFLEQYGELLALEGDWLGAHLFFEDSVRFSLQFSASPNLELELVRALKGSANALFELDRLDEARTRYEEVLTLDANDLDAATELAYVSELLRRR